MNRSVLKVAAVNLSVLALLGVLALAGVELWLRLTIPASSYQSIFEYTLDTPRYKLMKRNASVVAWGKELKTNDLGFRDDAPSVPAKRPGELRIVVLGASFTVSPGVEYRSIYTSLLEEQLKKSHPQAKVVNLAVAGYNIVQSAHVLREVGLTLQPDMVLVALCPDSDFSNDTYELNYRVASGKQPAVPAQTWYQELYVQRAYLGRAQARLERMLAGAPQPQSAGGESAQGWDTNVAALQAIADIARREKLPLAVALLPPTWNFETQRAQFGRVEQMCREHGLGCVNLLEPLIARGIQESALRLNPIDAHPNEKYHTVVAEELAPYVAAALGDAVGGHGLRQVSFPRPRPPSGAPQ